jgi:hypothetical protein
MKTKILLKKFKELYYKKQYTMHQMCIFFNVTGSAIASFRHRHDLPPRGWAKGIHPQQGKKHSLETIQQIKNSRKGKNTGKNNTNWKGGSYINNWGYRRVLKKNHFGSKDVAGYVLEHRYIIEVLLKRPLKSNEIVHHKNENKLDNRIKNLEITTRSTHAQKHFPTGSHFGINQL